MKPMINKEIGRSKFTIGILAGFLVGIFTSSWIPLDLWWTGGIIIGIAIGLIVFWSEIFYRWVLICLLGLFLGLGYYQAYNLYQNRHQLVYDQPIKIEGQIVEPVQIKPTKTQAILKYQGTKILVELPRYPEYAFGDTLNFTASIQNPKSIQTVDNFSYGQYLLDKNIHGLIKNPDQITNIPPQGWHIRFGTLKIIYSISDKFQASLMRVLPEPYASLQAGLILGNRVTQIPDSLTSAFNRTGTTHIIAVSGYNITIIISALALCFALFSRRFSFWATLISILIFIIMTGGSASVIRAGILGGLAAWGRIEGRRVNHTILILAVAFLMLLFNPFQLKGDVGFQLSFLAFAGLIYFSSVIGDLRWVAKWPSIVKTVFAETMSAQVFCLPVLIYNFGIFSLVAPIVNILVLPTIPLSMFLGFVAGLGGLIWIEIGKILGDLSWPVLKYIIVIVESFSKFSWAAVNVPTGAWWWIPVYYLVIVLLIKNVKKSLNEKS